MLLVEILPFSYSKEFLLDRMELQFSIDQSTVKIEPTEFHTFDQPLSVSIQTGRWLESSQTAEFPVGQSG